MTPRLNSFMESVTALEKKKWYFIGDAADYLDVGEPTLYRWMREGKITYSQSRGFDPVLAGGSGLGDAGVPLGKLRQKSAIKQGIETAG